MTEQFVRLHNIIVGRSDRGAAMAEYGLLLALVALGVMAVMATFGDTLAQTFGFASETFNNSPAIAGTGSTGGTNTP